MSGQAAEGRAEHILVVDDTPANLQLLRRLLTEHGYVVHPASDGELALEFVGSTLPDLILLDIRMPGMDGFEVCRRLKANERTRAVPVIVVSILEDQRDKVKGFQAGAVDYITKPFQPDEVLARVDLHLRVRELTERLEQKVGERTRDLVAANQRLQREITERTQAEQALRSSEARYRGLMLALGEGIVVYSADGRIVECNQEAERILGLNRDELGGLTAFDSRWQALREDGSPLPADQHPAVVTLATGQPCHGVVMRIRTDLGQDRWALVSGEPLVHPGESSPYGAVVSLTDITDVHRAHEEFRTLADNSPDFIGRYDRDGRRLYVNPALAQAAGLPAEQLVGRIVADDEDPRPQITLTRASATLLRAKLRETFDTGSAPEIELTYQPPGDSPRISHSRLVAEYDQDGRIRDVLLLGRDLTELKRAEQQLAEREEWFRLAFDDSLIGMALLSVGFEPRFQFLRVNRAMCEFLGHRQEDLLGLGPADVLVADAAADTETALRGLLSAELTNYRVELPFRHTGGHIVWGLLHATLIRDASGLPLYLLCQIEDVTERRHAEAEVRALNSDLEARVRRRTTDLEEANRNLEAFTNSVSHDLRAPLRALSGFAAILLADCADRLDESGRDYARRIDVAARQMAHLIDDLLRLSRAQRAEVRLKTVDLSAQVAEIAEDLRRHDPQRRCEFLIAPGVRATADPDLIRTVLENLVGNAWKFTAHRDEALIEFGTIGAPDPEVCCYVRDNGAGFDPAHADELFQPFRRLHPAQEFSGTGIGLASVRWIVERHGGRTWAEGQVDRGATVYFTLTACMAATAPGISH